MSAVAWLEREIERVTKRRRDTVAPPLTPLVQPMQPTPQQPYTFSQNLRGSAASANMNTMSSASGVPAMNDADVRRAEHPEEFRCAHGIWPGTYCGMCKRMI